jgi:ATP synthase protein I
MKPDDPRSQERAQTTPRPPEPARFGAKPRGVGSVAAGAGIQFAASIVVFLFLGQWLDRRLGTAPVFLFGCVFVGAGASFYSMYRQLMAAQRRDAEARAEARRAADAARDGEGRGG